jgi:hypothetical protein
LCRLVLSCLILHLVLSAISLLSSLFSKLCHDSLHLDPPGLVPTTLGAHHHYHHYHYHHHHHPSSSSWYHRRPCLSFCLHWPWPGPGPGVCCGVWSWPVMAALGFHHLVSLSPLLSWGMAVYDQKHLYPSPRATGGPAGSRQWSYFPGICWQACHVTSGHSPLSCYLAPPNQSTRHGQ